MRELIKAAARGVSFLLASPALLSYTVRAAMYGRDRALEASSQTLSLVPGLLGQYIRRAFYTRVLDRCHHTVTIEFGALFSKTGAQLDEHVYVGPHCHLGLVHLEHDVLLGPSVHIPSGADTHGTADLGVPIRNQQGRRTRVHVGANSWIGSNAVVMSDVGADTIIGAGAVVTSPIPDRVVAGGVPARVLKSRDGVSYPRPS